MNLQTRVGKNRATASRIIGGEAVIILPEKGEIKVLNAVASRVWELIDGTKNIREVLDQICQEFDVPPEQAETDVFEFLTELRDLQMIETEAVNQP